MLLVVKSSVFLTKHCRIDFYSLLNIEKTAGESEIKKAYFKKSKEYHPDRHANAEEAEKEEFSAKFKQAKVSFQTGFPDLKTLLRKLTRHLVIWKRGKFTTQEQ